jgi:hypothetical protein
MLISLSLSFHKAQRHCTSPCPYPPCCSSSLTQVLPSRSQTPPLPLLSEQPTSEPTQPFTPLLFCQQRLLTIQGWTSMVEMKEKNTKSLSSLGAAYGSSLCALLALSLWLTSAQSWLPKYCHHHLLIKQSSASKELSPPCTSQQCLRGGD